MMNVFHKKGGSYYKKKVIKAKGKGKGKGYYGYYVKKKVVRPKTQSPTVAFTPPTSAPMTAMVVPVSTPPTTAPTVFITAVPTSTQPTASPTVVTAVPTSKQPTSAPTVFTDVPTSTQPTSSLTDLPTTSLCGPDGKQTIFVFAQHIMERIFVGAVHFCHDPSANFIISSSSPRNMIRCPSDRL